MLFDFFGSLYVNGLIFTKTNGEFIVSERTKEGHQAWKYNHEKKEREKIMLFDGSGYFFSLENNGLLFLGVSLTLDSGRRGYDWFVSYPNQGTKKISDERYYYYPTPFFIKNSIAGFAEKNLGSEEDLAKLGKKYGEYSLEYVNLSSNIDFDGTQPNSLYFWTERWWKIYHAENCWFASTDDTKWNFSASSSEI